MACHSTQKRGTTGVDLGQIQPFVKWTSRIGGGELVERMQQACAVEFWVNSDGAVGVDGDCTYTDLDNGFFGDGSLGDACHRDESVMGFVGRWEQGGAMIAR